MWTEGHRVGRFERFREFPDEKTTENQEATQRMKKSDKPCTGFSSEIGTKLRDWAVGQAWGSCYSQAASSSNDSKTRYRVK